MKTIQQLAMLLAITAVVACGSKDKKKTEQPTPTGSATNEKVDTEPKTDTAEAEPAAAEPDPASLENVIYFEFDSSELDPSARAALEENVRWLKEDPKRTILIEGHTDESGTNEYNLGLGDRRARASKDYMVAMGIDEKRVRIITYGEERPVSNEDSKNRRSMFVATKK